jgi:hypothetical protein
VTNILNRYEKCDTDIKDLKDIKDVKNSEMKKLTFTDVLKSTADRALDDERAKISCFFDEQVLFSDVEKFIVFFCEGCLNAANHGKRRFSVSLRFRKQVDPMDGEIELLKKMGLNDYNGIWFDLGKKHPEFTLTLRSQLFRKWFLKHLDVMTEKAKERVKIKVLNWSEEMNIYTEW